MKKLLLTSALCAALSSSAMAGQAGEFYGEAGVKYVMFKKHSKDKVFKGLSSMKYDSGNEVTTALATALANAAVAVTGGSFDNDVAAVVAAGNNVAGVSGLTENSFIVKNVMNGRGTGANPAVAATLATAISNYYIGNIISDFGVVANDLSVKSKGTAALVVGGGYYPMDNVALGASLSYYFNPKQKVSYSKDNNALEGEFKSNIMAFMLEGTVDVVEMDMVKLYFNAGVGISRVKTKVKAKSGTRAGVAISQADIDLINSNNSKSFGSKTNFAWKVGLGVSGEFSEGMHASFGYSYTDLGKTKSVEKVFEESLPFKAHEIKLGLRFDI